MRWLLWDWLGHGWRVPWEGDPGKAPGMMGLTFNSMCQGEQREFEGERAEGEEARCISR